MVDNPCSINKSIRRGLNLSFWQIISIFSLGVELLRSLGGQRHSRWCWGYGRGGRCNCHWNDRDGWSSFGHQRRALVISQTRFVMEIPGPQNPVLDLLQTRGRSHWRGYSSSQRRNSPGWRGRSGNFRKVKRLVLRGSNEKWHGSFVLVRRPQQASTRARRFNCKSATQNVSKKFYVKGFRSGMQQF